MELEITDKTENKLINRIEVHFKVTHDKAKTPTRKEIKGTLADNLGAKKECVIVDMMRSEYGSPVTKGYAKVYKTQEDLKKYEKVHLIHRETGEGRKGGAKKEGGGAAPAKKEAEGGGAEKEKAKEK
jgi:small subunit ribosomal protein S24e